MTQKWEGSSVFPPMLAHFYCIPFLSFFEHPL